MSRPIVVGVDGSPSAEKAAQTAARLAVALGADLLIATAVLRLEVEQVEIEGRDYFYTSGEASHELAESIAEKLKAENPTLRTSVMVEPGKPADVLIQVADVNEAELIVVGNKRVQGPARLLGSIATDVAHRASCDVLIAYTHTRS